ncbi:MAG TPA: site-specific integrase [Planctomycetota bacterium]|nr:site-specific integrase [Planctomycetota bacterium]
MTRDPEHSPSPPRESRASRPRDRAPGPNAPLSPPPGRANRPGEALPRAPRGRGGYKPRLTEADRAISPAEVSSIVRWAEEGIETRHAPRSVRVRDYMIVRVLAETGLRASECARLEVRDLHLGDASPFLVVRGGKWRRPGDVDSVHLPRALAAELAAHIEGRDPAARVFTTAAGRSIARFHVYAAVKGAVEALGLNPRYSAHTLRHGYISALCRAPGATPYLVAKAARLRDLNVVMRYFHARPELLPALAESARVR